MSLNPSNRKQDKKTPRPQVSKAWCAGTDTAGTVKSVLPCTPLAIVKVLEHIGVYNRMLQYGDRARGKVITVINRRVQDDSIDARGLILQVGSRRTTSSGVTR